MTAALPGVLRVMETQSGRYTTAVIPLSYSEIPGFHATHFQAVRDDDPTRAVRLTLFERISPHAPTDHTRAA
ncbi:MAG: hypothetical protein M0R75_16435 [Dehalococcoidia bacterium]|nr:hypothetical protein [Dehalococcoidia bacterium]